MNINPVEVFASECKKRNKFPNICKTFLKVYILSEQYWIVIKLLLLEYNV